MVCTGEVNVDNEHCHSEDFNLVRDSFDVLANREENLIFC